MIRVGQAIVKMLQGTINIKMAIAQVTAVTRQAKIKAIKQSLINKKAIALLQWLFYFKWWLF